MKMATTKADRVLKRRRAKLDAGIKKVQRKIKVLTKALRKQTSQLSKRKARRARLK